MKILWLVNITFPEVDYLLTGNESLFNVSGGWLLGSAEALISSGDVKLYVVSVDKRVKKLTKLEGKKATYYLIPRGKGVSKKNHKYDSYCKTICQEVLPDVVHIHGTEFSHGNSYVTSCPTDNVVLSVQGILSAIGEYYHSGITKFEIYRNLTLFDMIRGSMIARRKEFQKRAKYEKETLENVKYVIGRTDFDESRVRLINPNIEYFKCNETLRNEFYDNTIWQYKKCKKHSIFISQSSYPLKGLHQVLKAMPLILKHYPDATIRIAGRDIASINSCKDYMFLTNYGKFIRSLIKRYSLETKVKFLGRIDGLQMKEEYLLCNVYICPSSVENSPNSLCEAQIIGTPCVASYVGGIPSLMRGNENNLYRFEEYSMLADIVCKVFSLGDQQINMIDVARERHDPKKNNDQLMRIYKTIIQNKK